jgi:glycosyltransferase involved in cell wall biosynthesis
MSKENPKVSIGLPVYNAEKYLDEALKAILSQTYTDFELIISDNASTDRTAEICKRYAASDSRIQYYRNETNLGVARNYNKTVELARGKYFRWATYDDLMAPQLLEKSIPVLDQEPEVILCYPKTINIDDDGNVLGNYEDNFKFRSQNPARRYRDLMRNLVDYDCNAEYGLMRREVLLKTAMEQNYHSADRVLLSELVLHGQFYEIPERLFYHRLHSQISTKINTTGSQFAGWMNPSHKNGVDLTRVRRIIEFIKAINRSPITVSQRLFCYYSLFLFYMSADKWERLFGRIAAFFQRK